MKNPYILFILFMCTSLIGFAQDSTTTALEEVVISASRLEERPIEVPRSVTVIGQTQIQKSMASNVGELLMNQEGLSLIGIGQNPGALQTAFLRGANGNHTVIMIDGVRISDPSSPNNGIDLAELALIDVERIEIVRGSHSTIYGTSAIGGVINIITKKANQEGFLGNVGLQVGTFGSNTLDFSQQASVTYMTSSGFYVGGSIINRNVDGLDATVDTVTTAGTFKNRDEDGFDKLDWLGKLGYRGEKLDVSAYYKRTSQDTDIDDGAFRDDPNYTVDFTRDLINYNISYDLADKWQLKGNGGYTYFERLTLDDSSIVDAAGNTDMSFSRNYSEGTVFNNELQLAFQSDKAKVLFGLGRYEETMTQKNFFFSDGIFGPFTSESDLDSLDLTNTINSVFAHAKLSGSLFAEQLSKWNLTVGTRFIDHNRFGSKLTYEVSPSVEVGEQGLLYFSFSTGFNAPALYQDYYRSFGVQPQARNLEPETSRSFELGLKKQVIENVSFSLAVYQTEVENSIEYVNLWVNKDPSQLTFLDGRGDAYINIGDQTNTGFELGLQAVIEEKFTFSANFNVVNGELRYEPSDVVESQSEGLLVQLFNSGAYLTESVTIGSLARRSNTINLAFGYQPSTKLDFKLDLRHVGNRDDIFFDGAVGGLNTTQVQDFTLVGFGVNYLLIEKLRLTFRIDNLFDTDYSEIRGFTTRGRGFSLKAGYSF